MIHYIKIVNGAALRVIEPELNSARFSPYFGDEYVTYVLGSWGSLRRTKGCKRYLFCFDSEDYDDISDTRVGAEISTAICDKLVELINAGNLKFEADPHWDDVRYAVYYKEEDSKYVPVCIQEFDLPDYDASNFVYTTDGERLEFYRSVLYNSAVDCDSLAEQLCLTVCNLLNS